MKEYVELGYGYNITQNASNDYLELIKISKNGKIDIDYIRDIYRRDRNAFLKLKNEILLRGGSFQLEKEQNILKNINIESNEFIFKSENGFKTLEINFEDYNLGDFLNKYKVKNDKFFNFMLIDAFKVIDRNVNIENLKEEFIKVGFEILKKETFERKYIDKVDEKCHMINQEGVNVELDDEYRIIEEVNNIVTLIPKDIKYKEIKKIFFQPNERIFVDYCMKNNILLINDLDGKSFYKFLKFKGVGKMKFNLIKEKLENIGSCILEIEPRLDGKYYDEIETKYEKYLKEIKELKLLNEKNEDIFTQKTFLIYCYENDKHKIKDILEEIATGFTTIPKLGTTKCKALFSELDKLISSTKLKNKYLENFTIEINEYWFEKIKFKKIKDITAILNIDLRIGNIEEKAFEKIQNTNLNEYNIDKELKKEFVDFIWKINKLKDINSIIDISFNILHDNDKKILNQRYLMGYTLEEIGNEHNLTRERIRQKIINLNKKLMTIYNEYNIIHSLNLEFINSKLIEIREILNLVNEENKLGIKIFLELKKELVFQDMETLVLNDNVYIEELNNEIIEYLDDEFIIDDVIDGLNEIYEIVGFKNLEKYKIEKHLVKLGYRKYGKLYSKNTLSLQKGYEWIANRYIENSIRMDDEGVDLLKRKYIEIFEEDISDKSIRTVEARIIENPNMICIDKSEYIYITKWNIDDQTKQVADKVLEDTLKLVEITTAQDIIKCHESKLSNVGIHNKYYFYSIIKHFFSDKYSIGKGNTMSITYYNANKDSIIISREDTVKECINDNGGIVLKSEILTKLRWELSKLEDTVSKSNEIIKIGNYITSISNNLLSESIKKKFKDMVNESLNKYGVVSTHFIYLNSIIDTELYNFFKYFNVKSGHMLAPIIKILDPHLKGHTNLLYYEESQIKSPEDIIITKFREVHKKQEMKNLLKEFGYKELSIANTFTKLIDEQEYYLISNIEIVYKDKLEEIEGDVINDVYSLLDSEIGENEYIVVNNISRLRRRLPRIDFTWEPELISSLVNGKKYKRVKRVYYDYVGGTDRVILVKDSSSIERFDELVKHIITNKYNGIKHIDHIYKFLVDQGVIYNNGKNRSLPYEILISKLFEIDEMGRFKIRE